MSDVGDNNFVRYLYRGEEDEEIPEDVVTHVYVDELTTVVRRWAFKCHPNIIEVICHDKVERIEEEAFCGCRLLRRVIMPGVTIIEQSAFCQCESLTDVDCGKLGIIGEGAFFACESLRSINLPSARILKECAFEICRSLVDVRFGNKLERIEERAFKDCRSLERITIPLTDGIITSDNTFQGCDC